MVFKYIDNIIQKGVTDFIEEWNNDLDYVIGHTSGSTGKPKEIHMFKSDMIASAKLTNKYFNITKDSTLLLCLSSGYIAGKMQIVRTICANATLVCIKPSSYPISTIKTIDINDIIIDYATYKKDDNLFKVVFTFRNFVLTNENTAAIPNLNIDFGAMVPMQVEKEINNLSVIKTLIIGGAPISNNLYKKLQGTKTLCYSTYGMTETVSHIALKAINIDSYKFKDFYEAMDNVYFEKDERKCLIIKTKHLSFKKIITNDIVELSDSKHFKWLGRHDNIINSGGIKFTPESIEEKISQFINKPFYITSRKSELLGNEIILLIEDTQWDKKLIDNLIQNIKKILPKYSIPKEIIFTSTLARTSSGKLIRNVY
ncbi:MAG: AMP-binding protein [Bacilli bacterium]